MRDAQICESSRNGPVGVMPIVATGENKVPGGCGGQLERGDLVDQILLTDEIISEGHTACLYPGSEVLYQQRLREFVEFSLRTLRMTASRRWRRRFGIP